MVRYKPHFVKVWTKGDPYSDDWRCYGATDDGKVYLINHRELRKKGNFRPILRRVM